MHLFRVSVILRTKKKGREQRFFLGLKRRGLCAAFLMNRRVFVTVQNRGLIAIPSATRRRYGLDEAGVQVEIIERDGEIVLRPNFAVPSDQVWFWTERWQRMEREADEEIKAGRVSSVRDVDEFLADLES